MVSKQAIFQFAAVTSCSSSTHNGHILKRNEMFTLVSLNVRNTKRKYNKKRVSDQVGEKFRYLYVVFAFENESIKSTFFFNKFHYLPFVYPRIETTIANVVHHFHKEF